MAFVPLRHFQAERVSPRAIHARILRGSRVLLPLLLGVGCGSGELVPAPVEQPDLAQSWRPVPAGGSVQLASGGVGLLTIRVPFDLNTVTRPSGALRSGANIEETWTHDQRIRVAAEDLAETLNRIVCGATDCGAFTVETWTGPADDVDSILVGRPEDFQLDPVTAGFVPLDDMTREQHLVRAHADGLLLLGAEPIGVEAAVWDFLHHVGYRFYVPQHRWEIVPEKPDLETSIDRLLGPAPGIAPGLVARQFAPPASARSEDPAWATEHNVWRTRNVVRRSFETSATHSWTAIYNDVNAATGWFTANPTSLSTGSFHASGALHQPKFCTSFQDGAGNHIGDVIYDHWVQGRLNMTRPSYSSRDSIMVEPSDGGGWNACGAGTAGGPTPSDRVVRLANHLSERAMADTTLPGDGPTWLQFYAYSWHSQPPVAEAVGPRILPLAANGYIRGGYTIENLIDGWHAAGAERVGVYDYWVHNAGQLPGRGGPAATRTLAEELRRWHLDHNAMAIHIDNDSGWGGLMLPFWVGVQVARDSRRTVKHLVNDFFAHAFPGGEQPHMRRFYDIIDASDQEVLLSWDLLREMWVTLDDAMNSTSDPAVIARIEDLMVYTRHVHNWMKWREDATPGVARVDLLDDLLRHAFVTRDRRMTAWRPMYRDPWSGDRELLEARYAPQLLSAPYGTKCLPNLDPAASSNLFAECINNHHLVWPDIKPTSADIASWVVEGLAIPATPGAADLLDLGYMPRPDKLVIPNSFPNSGSDGLGGHSRYRDVSTSNVDTASQYDEEEWFYWIDPAEGITFTDTCSGFTDGQIKSARALGPTTMELIPVDDSGKATGPAACTVSIPPDKLSRMITLSSACAGSDCPIAYDTYTASKQCSTSRATRELDTGVDTNEPDLGLGARFEPSASCDASFTEPGMYRLRVKNLGAGVRIHWPKDGTAAGIPQVHAVRWDTPFLPPDKRMPLYVAASRFFYVPEGTERFLMWFDGGNSCTIFRGSNSAYVFDPPDMPGFYEVETAVDENGDGVLTRHDGKIWQARLCNRIYLFDPVPQFTAAWPRDLMVPCSLIESSPADAANLGLPQDACLPAADTGDTGN